MKKNRLKLAIGVISAAVLFTAVSAVQGNSVKNLAVATAHVPAVGNIGVGSLSDQQLRDIALGIIPGTIVKTKYDYENGHRVVEYDIVDKNGIKRDLTLFTSNGKVYDIDYDYDAQGNRFINKDLFDVKISYEQAQQTALNRVGGEQVLAHKQEADYGLFIYEFIVRGNNGIIYEIEVETTNGTILKVKTKSHFNYNDYVVPPVRLTNNNVTTPTVPPTTTTPAPSNPAPSTPTPAPSTPGFKTEAQVRQIALSKFPGTVVYFEQDYDDGMMEYEYRIKQADGKVLEVKVNALGWVEDVDYEGQYVNGIFYKYD